MHTDAHKRKMAGEAGTWSRGTDSYGVTHGVVVVVGWGVGCVLKCWCKRVYIKKYSEKDMYCLKQREKYKK